MSIGIPNLNLHSNPNNTEETNNTEESPTQLHGHGQFVKGVVKEKIGNMTNSQSWQMSGQEAKAAGVEEMRAAKRTKEDGLREGYGQRDPKELEAEGRQEGAWGKAAGCPGMEERGDEKVRAACGRQDG